MNDWNPMEEKAAVESVRVFGIDLKRGDRVRLWPQEIRRHHGYCAGRPSG